MTGTVESWTASRLDAAGKVPKICAYCGVATEAPSHARYSPPFRQLLDFPYSSFFVGLFG